MTPEYIDFVKSLAKSGEDILASLTPEKCHMLHMAVGISGEVAELMDASSVENAAEELGGIEFYFTGLKYLSPVYQYYQLSPRIDRAPSTRELSIAAGKVLDQVKKHVVYNKDNLPEIANALADFENEMGTFYDSLGDRQRIISKNIDKLKVRYSAGYSDKAAQERADKKEGE